MEQALTLRPIVQLPVTDAILLDAARDIALLSDGLMLSLDAPLIAVAVPSDAWGATSPITLWGDRLLPCEERRRRCCDTPFFQPALDALCLAADALFTRLERWQWRDAHAPGLCAITDGTGVALSPRRPEPDAGAEWLAALARRGGALPILPLAADGVWALLRAERTTIH